MPLDRSTLLGSYEIVAALGAGGMGEVYRARDVRLNRIVAIHQKYSNFMTVAVLGKKSGDRRLTPMVKPALALVLGIGANPRYRPAVDVSGTYSVSGECIVTDNWSGGAGSQGSHVSVIVDHGKGFYILNNAPDAGGTISGEARKQ